MEILPEAWEIPTGSVGPIYGLDTLLVAVVFTVMLAVGWMRMYWG
jgi:flagellin-like protein